MKALDFIKSLPKEALEILSFVGAVLGGALAKIIRQRERKGVKVTVKKMCAEAFLSFFTAMIAYAVLDQCFHFNKFLTYMICSVAGANSTIFNDKLEDLIGYFFDVVKQWVPTLFKIKKNEVNQ